MRVRFILSVLAVCLFHVLNAQEPTSRPVDTVVIKTPDSVLVMNTTTVSLPATPAPAMNFQGKPSPYRTRFWVDGPIIAGGVGLTMIGYNMIVNKPGLTPEELAAHNPNDVPGFDRGNVGYYSESADKASYIPFTAAFALPVVASLIDKNQRNNFVQVTAMYLEAMSISGALYTLSAGALSRSRPLVYGTEAPYEKRVSNNSQRSFFAGHVSASATATFFAAQVFSDFNPDSRAKPYVWIAAAAIPAVVAYYRYEAGMHFLSDILVGYGVGAAVGILVPKLHRTKAFRNLTIIPQVDKDSKGLAFVYKL
jgi:membrane-associated phospholipid phosphatase